VIVVGLLLSAALFFGLRARTSGPAPAATAAAPTVLAAPAMPTGSVTVEFATAAPATGQPATSVARVTLAAPSAPSAVSHTKLVATATAKPQAKPTDGVDEQFKAPRR
jgi:hypothetical protein